MNKIKRRLTRRELKKKNKKIILSSLLIICLLSVGYGAFQTTLNINVTGRINKCAEGRVWNIDYTGDIKEIVIPCSGTYKLETWGAQGGISGDNTLGGYGGYSIGLAELTETQKIYVVVGGEGNKECTGSPRGFCDGGYNGGGKSHYSSDEKWGAGGGATHVSFSHGLLNTFDNNLSDLLIVSGGGGGAYSRAINAIGGSGGGHIGNNGFYRDDFQQSFGGNQMFTNNGYISGTFGIGGFCDINSANCSGGGSGYYGGGSARGSSGAGGSSYIGNPSLTNKAMYCYDCEESLDLTKPEVFTVSTTGDTNYKDTLNCPNGYSENSVSKCAKKGDGYARITLISKK